MPEMSCLFLIFYLSIRNGSIADRTPVDNTAALIDPAFFVHFAEYLGHRLITAFIHRETFSVPVTGGAELLQLADDPSAVFAFPVPCPLKEAFPSEIMLVNALFF